MQSLWNNRIERVKLFKTVFKTKAGEELLEYLTEKVSIKNIDTSNPNNVYVSLGEQKLLNFIKQQVNATIKEDDNGQ